MRRAPRAAARAVLALALACGACVAPPVENSAWLGLNAGVLEAFDPEIAGRYGVEYRFNALGGPNVMLGPSLGIAVSENGSGFLLFDLRRDVWLSERWVASPRAGFGGFLKSEDVDLGDPFEFRTGGEIEYLLGNGARLGLGFYHLSNAGIASDNPGTEVLRLSYSIPLGPGFP